MIGIYFSGTGNSRYALEVFIREYGNNSVLFSIEDIKLIEHINSHDEIVFSYPVQYSAVPKILSDFIHNNSSVWQGKRVFIIATMALFSGDGAGVLGRLLKQNGAKITGGLHLQMPDSIADEKVLKRSFEKNTQLVEKANRKVIKAVANIKNGKYPQEGLGILSRLAGFLSQRLWFGYRTRKYSDKLKVDADKCIGCSKCVTEAISLILKNSMLEINTKDIFAYNIHNCNIMVDFFIKMREKNYTPKSWRTDYADAYSANMDFGHVAPDWQYILNKGISGIISDLEENRKNNPQKTDYYDNRIAVYNAIKECFLRYADLADTKDCEKTSFIGKNLRYLSENPPESLYQALQLILLFYNFQTNLDSVTIRSLGGLDRMLYPFYKKDLESGRFSEDNLNEIVKYFLFKIKS